jgi:hypothetical protein
MWRPGQGAFDDHLVVCRPRESYCGTVELVDLSLLVCLLLKNNPTPDKDNYPEDNFFQHRYFDSNQCGSLSALPILTMYRDIAWHSL